MPLAFENYNSLNGMGCGLKTLDDIEKGTILIKQKTEMGFVSGAGLYDRVQGETPKDDEDRQLDELG